MEAAGQPFDDFRALLEALPGADTPALAAARKRNSLLTKPEGALGRLEEIAMWLAAWSGRAPSVNRPMVAVFAGNHGIAAKGITPYPATVTQQMVGNFEKGGAAINQICASVDLSLKIFDLALDYPTGDITVEPALSERDCAATMAYGMEAVAGGVDLLCEHRQRVPPYPLVAEVLVQHHAPGVESARRRAAHSDLRDDGGWVASDLQTVLLCGLEPERR